MMSTFSFLCVISLLLATSNAQTQINVVDTTLHSDVYRLGLNLGGRDTGSHMMKNMINNGGFEAREKATIMLADATSTTTVFVQAGWSTSAAQPNGFWDDASFIFLTGANQGVSGTITSFAQQGGKNTFTLSETLASAPQASDVMAVRSQFSSSFPHSDPRPNSVGKQSRVIDANAETPKRWNVMYDGGYRDIDYTLGRSLLINGSWTLNFWVKGNGAGEKFSFFFGRETWAGGAAFFSKTYTLNNTAWQEITEHFTISAENSDKPYFPTEPCQNWPSCQRPLVEISISKADGTSVLIDDLSLVQDGDTNPTIFTDRVVNLLKEYNPGVLRNWGGQLGASLKSELDYDFAKTTHGYKPTDDSLSEFTFSLHDFLVLCKEVGADPWYVVPPTFFPDEAQGLIEYLNGSPSSNWGSWRITRGQTEAWTSVFKNIYLEYGNELWGGGGPSDPFGGASMGGANLGKAANFTFHKMRQSSFFSDQIKLVIGGQAGWSGQNDYIESNADQHDILALAPYFGNLQVHDTVENSYGPLYAFPVQERITGNTNQTAKILADKGHGTTLALYEINFHYTDASEGTPPPSVRNPWMTGVAGGINLPWSMLNYLQYYGAQPSCAFSFLGYSFLYSGAAFPAQCDYPDCSFARVWGLMRDLSGLGTKRPTWLASTLVNRAMG